jgi:hypothetical protein
MQATKPLWKRRPFSLSWQEIADYAATSAEAVEQAGGTILPIPSNYYEDSAARFRLPDKQLDRMRRFNILYHRLGTGEFFQFYRLPFEQRFFFEVVQRSGSYDLYGRLERARATGSVGASSRKRLADHSLKRPCYRYVIATLATVRGCEGVRPAVMLTRTAHLFDCNCQGAPGDLRHDGQAAFASTSAAMRRSASWYP